MVVLKPTLGMFSSDKTLLTFTISFNELLISNRRWGKWIGPENNRYERFIMEGGVQCWNGPVRSVIVHVSCGIENQLIRAWEPNRCEYAYEFKTPAACVLSVGSAPDDSNEHQPVHTEL